MMRLDEETDLAVDSGDQGIQGISRDVDHRLAVGALQVRMRSSGLGAGRLHSQVVNGGRASDVGVGHQSKITKRSQSAIDRSPMDSGSRCFGAGDDLLRRQVVIGAVEDFDHGLASPGDTLMLFAEQVQGDLDPRRS